MSDDRTIKVESYLISDGPIHSIRRRNNRPAGNRHKQVVVEDNIRRNTRRRGSCRISPVHAIIRNPRNGNRHTELIFIVKAKRYKSSIPVPHRSYSVATTYIVTFPIEPIG